MDSPKWKFLGEAAGVLLVAFAVLLTISLGTYDQADPSFNRYLSGDREVINKAGIIGATLSDTLAQSLGGISWLFALGLLYVGARVALGVEITSLGAYVGGLILLIPSFSALASLVWRVDPLFDGVAGGGIIGHFVAEKMTLPWFGVYGSFVVLMAVMVLSVLVMFHLSASVAMMRMARLTWIMKGWMISLGRVSWPMMKKLKTVPIKSPFKPETPEERGIREKRTRIREKEIAEEFGEPYEEEAPPPPKIVDFSARDEEMIIPIAPKQAPKAKKREPAEETFQQEIFEFDEANEYEFPALGLLDSEPKAVVKQSKDDLIKSSRILEKKLLDFGIEGRVTQVLPGPVITIYEFEPAPGVKVSRIVSLADDLAMSLRALSIRVVAPIPGKSVVGIEAPSPNREAVYLKEILSNDEFDGNGAKIPLALGKDVAGKPVVADLASIPHLLIAGSTGSGKSVGINAMICSILYRLAPSDVKMIMIDPKMLELSIYDGIPHLIAPVVTNPKKAANALKWLVAEMERRYQKLSDLGVRNIDNYNKMVESGGSSRRSRKSAESETGPLSKLPYIVVVIDELADLMMVSSKEVEDSLARLAQMARAAGIHLIVATQRPSVDVLTGLIKANFPARISYQVRSRVDSRTILDSMGGEKLLGKGDLLYLPPGDAKLHRIQGPFVSDAEIHRVVDFLKGQRQPDYIEDILKGPSTEENGGGTEEDMDEFYDQAVELVAQTRQVSISMIQRRLRIGYNRAARIVEIMEKQGLVGPADGAKPREVYVRSMDDVETQYN